jgi:Holliday junction resolvasome RuvABC DNA-binding subunit
MFDPHAEDGTIMDEVERLLEAGDLDGIREIPGISAKEAQSIVDDELYWSNLAEQEDRQHEENGNG